MVVKQEEKQLETTLFTDSLSVVFSNENNYNIILDCPFKLENNE